jgi:uncharacterized membrane protein YccC
VKRAEIFWRWLCGFVAQRRAQLALSLRVTTAAIVALVVAQLVHIPLPLWTVITAVILTQMSVGRTLKATTDYLLGTVGGAVYGGLVAILIPHETELTLLIVFALAVTPLALLASLRQNMNVLPITAIIVLLMPSMSATHVTPFWSAVYRVLEVGLGGIIGLAVSFLVVPASAHRQMRQAAARMLELMARVLVVLLTGSREGLQDRELHGLQDGIGRAMADLDTIGAEAERERRARLSREPETGPLRRTLLRLRHDLVMVGRAAGTALPPEIQARLGPKLDAIAAAASDYLKAGGAALLAHRGPPPLEPFERALSAHGEEIASIRREGVVRALPAEIAERFFAMGFALEQLHRNFCDLERVVTEWGPAAGEEAPG